MGQRTCMKVNVALAAPAPGFIALVISDARLMTSLSAPSQSKLKIPAFLQNGGPRHPDW